MAKHKHFIIPIPSSIPRFDVVVQSGAWEWGGWSPSTPGGAEPPAVGGWGGGGLPSPSGAAGKGEAASGKPALLPDLWPTQLGLNEVLTSKMDEVCNMYINPVLDPFVEGLSEPFLEAADKARKQCFLAISLACAASAVIGFASGVWCSRRGGSSR